MAFSPDGKTLASGSVDRSIKLWVATSGTNTTLASGSVDKSIKLWVATSGTNTATLQGDTNFREAYP